MGTLRGDNGGDRPSEGGGLPGLPPEWGTIVIPDDAAELQHEATLIHKEMRRHTRRNRWRRRFGLPTRVVRAGDDDTPTLGLPLLIMSIAIIATLTSLFAIAWPSRAGQPASTHPTTPASTWVVPDLTLSDATGTTIKLRAALPAVVLMIDDCTCAQLITDTAKLVDPKVTVLAVARDKVPALPSALPADRIVRAAKDTEGRLHSAFTPSPQSAGVTVGTGVTVVVLKASGELVISVPDVKDVGSFESYLPQLK
jgi:hypothetical protein